MHPLEHSPEQMRAMLDRVAERVVDHIASLPEQDASYEADGKAAARAFAEALPEEAADFDGLSVSADGDLSTVCLTRPRFTPAPLGDRVSVQDLSGNQ